MANKDANERDDLQHDAGKDQTQNDQARKGEESSGRYRGGRDSDQDRQAKQGHDKAGKQGDGEKRREPAPSNPPGKDRRGSEEE